MYYCCILKNIKEGEIGNLHEKRFKEIWNKDSLHKVGDKINLENCPNRCKNNVINNTIQKLLGESENEHNNFL